MLDPVDVAVKKAAMNLFSWSFVSSDVKWIINMHILEN